MKSVLKLFMLILAVMCFSGCVVVNYFDLNKFKQEGSPKIFEFNSNENSVEIMEIHIIDSDKISIYADNI